MNFKIEAKVGVDNSGTINYIEVYNTSNNNTYCYDCSLNKNMNSADDFSFTMLRQSPGYNSFYVLGTAIKVSINIGTTTWYPIFLGRIVSIKTNFVGQKTVSCEGALAWFGDIIIRPHLWYEARSVTIKDETKPGGTTTITKYFQRNVMASEMMTYIDGVYTSRRSTERKVSFGSVSGNLIFAHDYDEETEEPKFFFDGVTDYNSALEWVSKIAALDSSCMYYAVPANDGWEAVINFVSALDTGTGYHMQYGVNLLDNQNDLDGSGFYTSVIGLGKDKIRINDWYYPNPHNPSQKEIGGEYDHKDNAGTGLYGVIERVETFDGKAGVELGNAASEYAQFGCGNAEGLNVSGIDPLFYDNARPLELGDPVTLTYPVYTGNGSWSTSTAQCMVTSIHMDIDRPGECSYTFFPTGTAFRKTTAKTLSQMIADSSNVGLTQAEYMSQQQAISYRVAGDDTVFAEYTDGREDMYQLVEDESVEGGYRYQKLVGGMIVGE